MTQDRILFERRTRFDTGQAEHVVRVITSQYIDASRPYVLQTWTVGPRGAVTQSAAIAFTLDELTRLAAAALVHAHRAGLAPVPVPDGFTVAVTTPGLPVAP